MNGRKGEVLRIAWSMTLACLVGSAILGVVYIATNRYAEAARLAGERRAITDMLDLDSTATVVEIRQFLTPDARQVVYHRMASAGTEGMALRFSLDGTLVDRSALQDPESAEKHLKPLGRVFAASRNGSPAGFVIEGETRGYKNTIRFFVALDARYDVAGVRVVEHEEDPGLGAEVATTWFEGQFVGRSAASLESLTVSRVPMPEDWRAALNQLAHVAPAVWLQDHRALVKREHALPIHAVSGATITSEALTRGVRTTVDHFRRRWALIGPLLRGVS